RIEQRAECGFAAAESTKRDEQLDGRRREQRAECGFATAAAWFEGRTGGGGGLI
ncbi:hypothetical protein A2U01_0109991, partial [Trifolium medium]|nr:hypothetical protein [Trifolium medium]